VKYGQVLNSLASLQGSDVVVSHSAQGYTWHILEDEFGRLRVGNLEVD